MRDERLTLLLDTYLDGALTTEERRELERMLLESDAARREFWRRASLHGWTYQAAKLNHAVEPGTVTRPDESHEPASASAAETVVAARDWLSRLRRWAWWGGLATACLVLAAFIVFRDRAQDPGVYPDDQFALELGAPSATNAVAMLTRAAGVAWADSASATELGSTLWPGWIRLRTGVVQIEFFSGARIILEGPAEFRLVSQTEAVLRSGRLSAEVPPQARGFKVRSPGVTVVDLGTAFGVAKMPSRQPEVHVFSGKVELTTPQNSQPTQELVAGQAMSVGVRTSRSYTADPTAFVTPEGLAEREAAEQRARYEAWKQNTRLLSEDPATLVHFTFEEDDHANRTLVNHAVQGRPESQGGVVGCEWVDGRWPGKGALEFKRAGDRVRLIVPGETRSLTYLMWLRVDSLPHPRNALVLPQAFREREVHWQLSNAGGVWFSIRRGNPMDEEDTWDRIITRPVLTAHQFSRWVQLAAVYDGESGRMAIYLNGEIVEWKIIQQPVNLSLGILELGNWDPQPESPELHRWIQRKTSEYLVRSFHGRIDEFAMLKRGLTAEEIRMHYELGKPRGSMVVAETGDTPRNRVMR